MKNVRAGNDPLRTHTQAHGGRVRVCAGGGEGSAPSVCHWVQRGMSSWRSEVSPGCYEQSTCVKSLSMCYFDSVWNQHPLPALQKWVLNMPRRGCVGSQGPLVLTQGQEKAAVRTVHLSPHHSLLLALDHRFRENVCWLP